MKENEIYIPVWKKSNLTIDEAIAYTGLGMHKLAEIAETEDSSVAFWTGKKRLFRRKRLDDYLDNMFSI